VWIVTIELSEHPDEVNSMRMGVIFVVIRSVSVAVTETFLRVVVTVIVPCGGWQRAGTMVSVMVVAVGVVVPVRTVMCFCWNRCNQTHTNHQCDKCGFH